MAMYFPYLAPAYYSDVRKTMQSIGMDDTYAAFFSHFVSILGGSKTKSKAAVSPLTQLTGVDTEPVDYTQYDWYDASAAAAYEAAANDEAYNELPITEKGEGYVLELPEEKWDGIVGIELQVWREEADGYVDLGSDSMWEFDDDGDLLLDFDGTWVALNGQIVPFYLEAADEEDEERWMNYGGVPLHHKRDQARADYSVVQPEPRWDCCRLSKSL